MMIDFWFFAIIFGTLFLLGKAVWQDSKSFKSWKFKKIRKIKNSKEHRDQRIKNLRKKMPHLKTIYIIVAGAIGLLLLYVFGLVYLEILNINWAEATSGNSGIRNLAIAFLGTTTGIGALFGVYLAILKSETNERQTHTAEQGQITDRLNEAIKGLGKNDESGKAVIELRLGALLALERIAQDSLRDHVQIMEILCSYIRTNSPFHDKTDDKIKLREDIHAAIKIIGRRKKWPEGKKRIKTEEAQNFRIDLSYCDLHGADLYRSHLVWTNLSGANLNNANLGMAKLNNAHLDNAKLKFANFNWAELTDAHLEHAKLNSACLLYAKMRGTYLNDADLTNATMDNANINFARLYDTNMKNTNTDKAYANICDFSECKNLTQKQLEVMFCGKYVRMPKNLTRPKHWLKYDLLWNEFEVTRNKWIDSEKTADKMMDVMYDVMIEEETRIAEEEAREE